LGGGETQADVIGDAMKGSALLAGIEGNGRGVAAKAGRGIVTGRSATTIQDGAAGRR
jgi:hypothetical protein